MNLLLTDCATLGEGIDLSCFQAFGETRTFKNISRRQLLDAVPSADVILCNKTLIDREVLDAAKKLRYIGLFATGCNNIDLKAAAEKGIAVCNAGSYSTNAVVQQVMGYILLHYTRIPQYDAFVKAGGWKKSEVFSPLVFQSDEVFGKTLGIVGYGHIGQALRKAAEGLGMRVIVYTRTPKQGDDTAFVSFETLLAQSDIVSMHCPLNPQSEKMMNEQAFAAMKDGAFFINTARGGVVDESALLHALQSGKLSGAAVDVLTTEPMAQDCVLMDAPNLIFTPHTAWAPLATRQRLVSIVYDNLSVFLNGGRRNRVV